MIRVENKPRDAASTPWPIQIGWRTTFACTVEMSGNAVTMRVAMTSAAEEEVKVVKGLNTVIGTEVVNAVKLPLRNTDEVALASM